MCLLLVGLLMAASCARRGNALGDLSYFPGATIIGSTSFVGAAFGFPRSAWDQVELRSAAPYPQVRDFYAKVKVAEWTSTFESEAPKYRGKVYTRVLADNRRKRYYVITIEERQGSRDVSILLRRGVAQ